MGYWNKPNRFVHVNFIEIPEGDHRVQICHVYEEEFSEKRCYEITLKVSGCHGKLWYYLWFDPTDKAKNAKKFKAFFDSFNIQDYNLKHYESWVGKFGAVRVAHREGLGLDVKEAFVLFCICGSRQRYLPAWHEAC